MSKKILKIFLITSVIIALTAVIFMLAFPKPKIDLSYNISNEVSENKDIEYIMDNFALISNKLESFDLTGTEDADIVLKMNNCNSILEFLDRANEKMQTGLIFNERTKNYDRNVKKLKKAKETLNKDAIVLKDFMEKTYIPYIKDEGFDAQNMLRYNNTFKEDYYKFIQSYNNYFQYVFDIYEESAVLSLQVNEITKLQNLYIAQFADDFLNKVINKNEVVELKYMRKLSFRKFEKLTLDEIQAILDAQKNIDVTTFINAVVNNELDTLMEDVNVGINYKTFASKLFNI